MNDCTRHRRRSGNASDLRRDHEEVTITRAQVEDYRFLRLYSIDLEMAKQGCDLLAAQTDLTLRHALLRDLIVTYGRPFSTNRGRVHKRHRLPDSIVPFAKRRLHAELKALRDQSFAHTDHDFRNPQIARWPRKSGGATYALGFSNPSYDLLLSRLPEIRDLIVTVENAVNALARTFESDFNKLYPEEALHSGPTQNATDT